MASLLEGRVTPESRVVAPVTTVSDDGSAELGPHEFNIGRVAPGMSTAQVYSLLGPPREIEGGMWSYRRPRFWVQFDSSGKVHLVRGHALHLGERLLLRNGDSRQDVKSVLGEPTRS